MLTFTLKPENVTEVAEMDISGAVDVPNLLYFNGMDATDERATEISFPSFMLNTCFRPSLALSVTLSPVYI